jgi:hypothetical protein
MNQDESKNVKLREVYFGKLAISVKSKTVPQTLPIYVVGLYASFLEL